MIILEYTHLVVVFVVMGYALYSMYRKGEKKASENTNELMMVAAMKSLDLVLSKLESDSIITVGVDENGNKRAYPGTLDIVGLDDILSQLEDKDKSNRIRDLISVVIS